MGGYTNGWALLLYSQTLDKCLVEVSGCSRSVLSRSTLLHSPFYPFTSVLGGNRFVYLPGPSASHQRLRNKLSLPNHIPGIHTLYRLVTVHPAPKIFSEFSAVIPVSSRPQLLKEVDEMEAEAESTSTTSLVQSRTNQWNKMIHMRWCSQVHCKSHKPKQYKLFQREDTF